jgi:uncharacterized protein (DUF486 family)
VCCDVSDIFGQLFFPRRLKWQHEYQPLEILNGFNVSLVYDFMFHDCKRWRESRKRKFVFIVVAAHYFLVLFEYYLKVPVQRGTRKNEVIGFDCLYC